MRSQHDDPARALRRVHRLQRVSGLQVRQAELHRDEVPAVQGWRTGGKRARKGNTFYGCSNYPKCRFTLANKPIAEKCPDCGHEYLVEKMLKAGPVIACPNKECEYSRPAEPVPVG